jgi:hypothetical protein
MKETIRVVILNIAVDKEKELLEGLGGMVKKGVFTLSDVHIFHDKEE